MAEDETPHGVLSENGAPQRETYTGEKMGLTHTAGRELQPDRSGSAARPAARFPRPAEYPSAPPPTDRPDWITTFQQSERTANALDHVARRLRFSSRAFGIWDLPEPHTSTDTLPWILLPARYPGGRPSEQFELAREIMSAAVSEAAKRHGIDVAVTEQHVCETPDCSRKCQLVVWAKADIRDELRAQAWARRWANPTPRPDDVVQMFLRLALAGVPYKRSRRGAEWWLRRRKNLRRERWGEAFEAANRGCRMARSQIEEQFSVRVIVLQYHILECRNGLFGLSPGNEHCSRECGYTFIVNYPYAHIKEALAEGTLRGIELE